MTIQFNTNNLQALDEIKSIASKNNISINIIDNSIGNEILSLPGNPVTNEKLKEYLQRSMDSGYISIDEFKMKLLAK